MYRWRSRLSYRCLKVFLTQFKCAKFLCTFTGTRLEPENWFSREAVVKNGRMWSFSLVSNSELPVQCLWLPPRYLQISHTLVLWMYNVMSLGLPTVPEWPGSPGIDPRCPVSRARLILSRMCENWPPGMDIWLFTNECIVFCIVFVSHTRLDLTWV